MRTLSFLVICLAVFVLCVNVAAQGPTQFIAVNGINGSDIASGIGWGQAVKHINKGIERAKEHNLHEVWVIGTEYNECVEIDRYRIELYGGFQGWEFERSQRNYISNITTIIGKCDDVFSDYCPTVTINMADNTIVDGFTITHGGGTMPPSERYGGGFYIKSSNQVWLHNNIITDNKAIHGGGIYAKDSGLWVKNCNINNNIGFEEGGGIFMDNSDFAPFLEKSILDNNLGSSRGGNLLMDNTSEGDIIYNQFTNGQAVKGANIACYSSADPYIHENSIASGAADQGGGFYLNNSSPTIRLNTILGNSALGTDAGGGIHCTNGCASLIERNRIKNNFGEYSRGGGIYTSASSPSVINNIIDYNTVKTSGGGMAVDNASNVTVTNNTFAWNQAWEIIGENIYLGNGGAIWIANGSTVTAQNNIFYEDLAYAGAEVYVCLGCTYNHDYNDYWNNRPYPGRPIIFCEDNQPEQYCPLNANELMVNPEFLDDDYHLGSDSFVIDKGNNNAPGIIGTDYVDGDGRIIDGDEDGSAIVDMGADEFWPPVAGLANGKKAALGTPVEFEDVVVTVAKPDYVYVEASDRSMGIRVDKPGHTCGIGQMAYVYGHIRVDENAECYVDAITLRGYGDEPIDIDPLAMSNKRLGGGTYGLQRGVYSWTVERRRPPWAIAEGLNNIGLLVRICGRVTYVRHSPMNPSEEFCYIDDGSMLFDDTFHGVPPNEPIQPNRGVRLVSLEGLPLPVNEGMYISVTGISSCLKFENDPVRLLKIWPLGSIRFEETAQ